MEAGDEEGVRRLDLEAVTLAQTAPDRSRSGVDPPLLGQKLAQLDVLRAVAIGLVDENEEAFGGHAAATVEPKSLATRGIEDEQSELGPGLQIANDRSLALERDGDLAQLVVDRSQEPLLPGQQRRMDPAFRTDARGDRQALAGEKRPEALRQAGREDLPHPPRRLAQAGAALDLDLSGMERLAHAA